MTCIFEALQPGETLPEYTEEGLVHEAEEFLHHPLTAAERQFLVACWRFAGALKQTQTV